MCTRDPAARSPPQRGSRRRGPVEVPGPTRRRRGSSMSSSSSFSLPEVRESLRDARTFGRLEKPLRCIKFARRKDVRGHIAFGRKRKAEGRTSVVLRFVRVGVADPGLITGFVRLARGSIVVVLGRLLVVIAGLVVILNLALARRECVVGGLVCPDRLVVVARLIPFAGLIVRFVMVLTARNAAGRCGAAQDVAGLMKGHTRSDRRHEGEGEHGQYQMCHEVPP